MAAVLKKKLKAARDALGEKDFEAAKAAALQVLDYEPGNYNAYVGTCGEALTS
jgi:superkiller protein 3